MQLRTLQYTVMLFGLIITPLSQAQQVIKFGVDQIGRAHV